MKLTASPYEYCYANSVRFSDPSGEQVPPEISYTNSNVIQTTTATNPTPADQSKTPFARNPNGGMLEKFGQLQISDILNASRASYFINECTTTPPAIKGSYSNNSSDVFTSDTYDESAQQRNKFLASDILNHALNDYRKNPGIPITNQYDFHGKELKNDILRNKTFLVLLA